MSAASSTGNALPTPDSLRLNRLDRLIDQLGEHQLTIRQQGVSVTDLSQRLKNLETKLQTDYDSLLPLKDVDIVRQLAGLHASIEKLQRQANARTREQEDFRIEQELRLQQLEQRQAATETSLRQLEERFEDVVTQQEAELEDLRQSMRSMMSEVVGRIADQFDAVQSSLEEAISTRDADRQTQAAATRSLQDSVTELRTWSETQNSVLRHEVSELLRAESQAAAAQTSEHLASLAAVSLRQDTLESTMQAHTARISGVEEAQTAAETRESQSSERMQQALAAWQQGMEAKWSEASAKFEEYKAYVGRLRKEIKELQEESEGTHTALVGAIAKELGRLGAGVALLQQDSAGLLGQARKTASISGVALSGGGGSAVRHTAALGGSAAVDSAAHSSSSNSRIA